MTPTRKKIYWTYRALTELYSIVRGKAGKSVEFGLKWGINHISGFIFGFLMIVGSMLPTKVFVSRLSKSTKNFSRKPQEFSASIEEVTAW